MTRDDLEWWPMQLQEIFAAVGAVNGNQQLRPEMLQAVRLPDAQFSISHVSGKALARRKGFYSITMPGGEWKLSSGELQKLARAARRAD